jgi:hypothetical protein
LLTFFPFAVTVNDFGCSLAIGFFGVAVGGCFLAGYYFAIILINKKSTDFKTLLTGIKLITVKPPATLFKC